MGQSLVRCSFVPLQHKQHTATRTAAQLQQQKYALHSTATHKKSAWVMLEDVRVDLSCAGFVPHHCNTLQHTATRTTTHCNTQRSSTWLTREDVCVAVSWGWVCCVCCVCCINDGADALSHPLRTGLLRRIQYIHQSVCRMSMYSTSINASCPCTPHPCWHPLSTGLMGRVECMNHDDETCPHIQDPLWHSQGTCVVSNTYINESCLAMYATHTSMSHVHTHKTYHGTHRALALYRIHTAHIWMSHVT